MKGRLVFALIFAGLVSLAFWLIASPNSPWSEDLSDSLLEWLLTPFYLVPYLVVMVFRPQHFEEFVATSIVFLEGLILGLPLYSLFTHFFRKSDVGKVSISETTRPKEE